MKKFVAIFLAICIMIPITACVKQSVGTDATADGSTTATVIDSIDGSNALAFSAKLNKDFMFDMTEAGKKNEPVTSVENNINYYVTSKTLTKKGTYFRYSFQYKPDNTVILAEFEVGCSSSTVSYKDLQEGAINYLGYCATMPFDGSNADEARAWVQNCFNEEEYTNNVSHCWGNVRFYILCSYMNGEISGYTLSITCRTPLSDALYSMMETTATEAETEPPVIGISGSNADNLLKYVWASFPTVEEKEAESTTKATSESLPVSESASTSNAAKSGGTKINSFYYTHSQYIESNGYTIRVDINYDAGYHVISATIKLMNNAFIFDEEEKFLNYASQIFCNAASMQYDKAHPDNVKTWIFDCIEYRKFMPDGKARAWSDAKFEINYTQVDGNISSIWLTISKYKK